MCTLLAMGRSARHYDMHFKMGTHPNSWLTVSTGRAGAEWGLSETASVAALAGTWVSRLLAGSRLQARDWEAATGHRRPGRGFLNYSLELELYWSYTGAVV